MKHQIICGDCLNVLKDLDNNSIDLIVTDPPYALSFMGMEWDKALPNIEIWKQCLRVLKPGSFAFIMSIPRQDCLSRMIINLENAGFKVNFTSIYHVFASGFPKAYNIANGIEGKLKLGTANWSEWDKLDGEKGVDNLGYHKLQYEQEYRNTNYQGRKRTTKVELSTDKAKEFDGSYAGFQPKPAVEVILVVMKPLSEKTYVDQAMKNGKGITWLHDVRIPFTSENDMKSSETGYIHTGYKAYGESDIYHNAFKRPCQDDDKRVHPSKHGRFTANLLVSDDALNVDKEHLQPIMNVYSKHKKHSSFSRHFDIDAWWQERIKKLPKDVQKTFPFLIVPKASRNEKDKGLKYLPIKDIPYSKYRNNYNITKSYVSKYPDGKPRPMNKMKNDHPTTKPLTLMSYLITLGSRKNDIVLDPFVGSGTVSLAAKMLSRKSIGIEINSEYVKIAKARLKSVSTLDEWI